MNYYKNNIRHIKGDTFSSALVIEGLGKDLDSAYFTCRDTLNDNSEILFEKSLNKGISLVEYDEEKDIRKYAIRIAPIDTKELQEGTYFYDLQIKINNDIFTIMKGKFILEQDATRKEGESEDPELYIKVVLDEINGEVIGTTVINKTNYLSETKSLIKNELNNIGAGLTNSNTFRSYTDAIKNIYNNYPKITGEGTSFSLTTNKGKLTLQPKGNITQYTTTGKNLIDTNNFETIESKGLTITKNDDGSFNIVGTATSSGSIVISNNFASKFKNGSTYAEYLSEEYGSQLNIYCRLTYANSTINLSPTASRTINTSQYGSLNSAILFLYVTNENVYDYHNLRIMIAEGTSFTDEDYEPFTDGISPNPIYPQKVKVVTGNNIITINNGTNNQSLPLNLGDLWLGKINNYEDYFYNNNDNWYLKKMIAKVVLNGTETSLVRASASRYNFTPTNTSKNGNSENPNVFSSHYKDNYSTNNYSIFASSLIRTISIMDNRFSTLAEYKTWLSNNNVTIYYVLNNSIDIEITDTSLKNQLDNLYTAMSSQDTTNISSSCEEGNVQMIILATALMKGGN